VRIVSIVRISFEVIEVVLIDLYITVLELLVSFRNWNGFSVFSIELI